jgi:hypothetical protein
MDSRRGIIGEPNMRSRDAGWPALHVTQRDIFEARCEVRAYLFAAGELTLHDAVDVLQGNATAIGLVEVIGQDAVQAIMADAFASVEAGGKHKPLFAARGDAQVGNASDARPD